MHTIGDKINHGGNNGARIHLDSECSLPDIARARSRMATRHEANHVAVDMGLLLLTNSQAKAKAKATFLKFLKHPCLHHLCRGQVTCQWAKICL